MSVLNVYQSEKPWKLNLESKNIYFINDERFSRGQHLNTSVNTCSSVFTTHLHTGSTHCVCLNNSRMCVMSAGQWLDRAQPHTHTVQKLVSVWSTSSADAFILKENWCIIFKGQCWGIPNIHQDLCWLNFSSLLMRNVSQSFYSRLQHYSKLKYMSGNVPPERPHDGSWSKISNWTLKLL